MTDRTTPRARVHAPGTELDVQPYDFESPELISGAQRQRLETAFTAWGVQVATQIIAKTRAVAEVVAAPFQIQAYGALTAPDAGGRAVFLTASLGDHGALAVYRVPLAEAHYWAARMVGAAAAPDDTRPLTSIERGLAWRMAEEQVADLRSATEGLLAETTARSFGAEPTASLPADTLMVAVPIELTRRGETRRLVLALPVTAALEALGDVAGAHDPAAVRSRIEQHLAIAPVEVALRFEPMRVGPSTVLSLARGDLIPLTHPSHRPLTLALDGTPVAAAAVGGNGERLACVVIGGSGGPS